MKKYEYKVITFKPDEKHLNDLGSQGWELVNITTIPADYNPKTIHVTFYFKREKQPQPQPHKNNTVYIDL